MKKKKLNVYKWTKPQKAKWWERLLGVLVLQKIGELEYKPKKNMTITNKKEIITQIENLANERTKEIYDLWFGHDPGDGARSYQTGLLEYAEMRKKIIKTIKSADENALNQLKVGLN